MHWCRSFCALVGSLNSPRREHCARVGLVARVLQMRAAVSAQRCHPSNACSWRWPSWNPTWCHVRSLCSWVSSIPSRCGRSCSLFFSFFIPINTDPLPKSSVHPRFSCASIHRYRVPCRISGEQYSTTVSTSYGRCVRLLNWNRQNGSTVSIKQSFFTIGSSRSWQGSSLVFLLFYSLIVESPMCVHSAGRLKPMFWPEKMRSLFGVVWWGRLKYSNPSWVILIVLERDMASPIPEMLLMDLVTYFYFMLIYRIIFCYVL